MKGWSQRSVGTIIRDRLSQNFEGTLPRGCSSPPGDKNGNPIVGKVGNPKPLRFEWSLLSLWDRVVSTGYFCTVLKKNVVQVLGQSIVTY